MFAPTTLSLAALTLLLITSPVSAASSKFCVGGSYKVLGKTGTTERFRGQIDAPAGKFLVAGQYTQFLIDPADFSIHNYSWTGKANVGDMTDGKLTTVFASKIPDHRGLTLTSKISLELRDEDLKISRTGTGGLSMSISAKDCAQGGIFQMEPERNDNARTRIIHTLAPGAFHYDNDKFRAQLGKYLGSQCVSEQSGPPDDFCVRVGTRVNIGRDDRPKLVLRDSAQVATRIGQGECGPDFENVVGVGETRNYCGGMAVWDVASGGRMGMVTGEDAVEVANPPTECVSDCQAQNNVEGELAVLGFPFPAPQASRLSPRTSNDGRDAPLTAPFGGKRARGVEFEG